MANTYGDTMSIITRNDQKGLATILDPHGNRLQITQLQLSNAPITYSLSCQGSSAPYTLDKVPDGMETLVGRAMATKGFDAAIEAGKQLSDNVAKWWLGDRGYKVDHTTPPPPPTGTVRQDVASNVPSPLIAACKARQGRAP